MLSDLLDLNGIMELPDLEWSIDNLIPRGGIGIIAGDPKAGKSVITLDMAIRGIRNRLAFGRHKQNYNRVLVVNIEGRHQGIKMRTKMFRDLAQEERSRILVSGERILFSLPNGQVNAVVIASLMKRIKEEGIDFVIMDPLVSLHQGDENNSQQMVALLDAIRDVGEATRAGFFIIHHSRKMGNQQTLADVLQEGGRMMRGASGIFGAVDVGIMVWKAAKNRRVFNFSTRYADCDVSDIEMQMDKHTWRMYPIAPALDLPDPHEWCSDWGEDWERYRTAFGLTEDAVGKARKGLSDGR